MAEATTSRYESNYIKIAMVVLRVSPRAVRVEFDKEFHPVCLERTLKGEWGRLSDLKTHKRITQAQWNLLFPRTGEQPSSKGFDITLMICLLRNLIPIDIMDRLPSATDTSVRADLSRIKFYRNFVVHCDCALVADTDFESYWKDITLAILRLGGNSLKVECDDWYGRNLDVEQRDDGLKCIKDEKRLALVEEELAEQSKKLVETNKKLMELEQEQSNPVPKNIRELFTEEIESWKKDKFFEASAVATILKEVRNKAFVVITGPSGIGKSTIVKLVALQLLKTNDYDILPIMCPKDIVRYFDPNIKQIYIIDDICGKFSVDQSMINSWERVNRQILKYSQDNKDFRVLGTCRLEISISSPFRKLQEKHEITECNLLQKKFLYSKEEKLKIAACHIDEKTIKQLDDKILSTYNMFPLLCKMYAASKSNPGVRFFEYPLQAVEEQLDKMKEQNECCFIGLALIVVYNNKLYKRLLQNGDDKKFEDVFNDVFEDLGLVNRPSKRSVLSGLQAQEGIYTKEFKRLESTITIIHDKIFDILSLYFGKRIPKTILTHGCGAFIAERFLFESIEEDCDDLKIVLPSELEHSYFNRMVEEIENNRFYSVFGNIQVHNELYQGKFISFLSKHAHQKLLDHKWPLYMSAAKGCKLLVQFILDGNHQDNLMDKPESDMYFGGTDLLQFYETYYESITDDVHYRVQFENSPMVAACEGGYIDIVDCLVKNGYDIDHSYGHLPTPLYSACRYGNKDVVDFLLKRNCKVDAMDKRGRIALHAACENGNIDIVTSLLKYNSSVNLCDISGYYTPLYIACIKGHTDVVQILLDNNFDTRQANAGCKDIVETLIKHNVDINDTESVIDYGKLIRSACYIGHTDIVKLLLDNSDFLDDNGFSHDLLLRNNCNINQCEPQTNKSPLIIACHWNKGAVGKMLLSYEACDVNIIDWDNCNALHYACRKGQIDVVELLLKRHCNVNHNDNEMKTPLFYACEEGHVDIVKMLINQDNCMIDVLDVKGNSLLHATYGKSCQNDHYKTPDMLYSTKNGRIEIIGLLLDKGCDANVLDNKGQSVLHVACEYGDTEIVDILLRSNSNVNQCDKAKETPLFIACGNGYIDIVRLLIESKCEISNRSPFGQTVFHTVCHGGVDRSRRSYLGFKPSTEDYKDILTLLIDKKCDVNILDNNSQTPLHIACYKGNVALVEILLRNKCVVDQCDNLNKTPFFLACEEGHKDVVKSLMNNNCNVHIRDKIGRSALYVVCTTRSLFVHKGEGVDIAELLINKRCGVYDLDDAGQSVLHAACEYGHTKIVDMLLRSNSNVNQCDKANKTPLFIACEEGYIDIVRLLIESKCEIFNHSLNGQTVLHAVCSGHDISHGNDLGFETFTEGHKDILTLLIDKKCDVNISDNNSQTPLHIACYKGNVTLVEILLRNKCVVDQCDNLNKTPFFLACEKGHKDVVKSLMNNNCNVYIRDQFGHSALHAVYTKLFSSFGHKGDRVYIAELLINKRCGVYDLNNKGQSILHAACEYGHTKIVDMLLRSNCNVNQCDKAKKTPLFIACKKGDIDIVKLLIESKCEIFNHSLNGQTVLHAVCSGHDRSHGNDLEFRPSTEDYKDILTLLIDKKCDVNISDNNSQTPLHIACYKGNVALVEILLRNKCVVDQCDNLNKTPFFLACEKGHKDVVKSLMNNNCNVYIRDQFGHSALHAVYTKLSSWFGYGVDGVDIAEIFINKRCGVYNLNNEGQSILHAACEYGHTKIVDMLLSNSNVNQCDKAKKTPLFIACEKGYIDIVRLLIESKCEIFNHSLNGQTVLHAVCIGRDRSNRKYEIFGTFTGGHKDILTLLIDKKCDVNISDDNSQTPLHIACKKGNVALVEILLRNKCVVDQCDNLNKTPFFLACEEGHKDVVKSLMNNNCNMDIRDKIGRSALHAVCTTHSMYNMPDDESDRVDIAELLIDKRCGVCDLDDAGQSALHVACEYGNTGIVDILLSSNSKVNQCDKANKTPLFIACENRYLDIVNQLIESKCEIFNHSLNGQTVLHAVCSGRDRSNRNHQRFGTFIEGQKDILTLLIDKKCDVNISDNNSQTPLHIACYKGNVALVEILLRNKCVVDQCDNLNKTPFFLACEEGHKDVVKSLMNNNCNMDIRDKIGRSALQAVCTTHTGNGYEGHRDVAELLINNKCGVYHLDDAGQSALHGACKQGNPGIVKLLLENTFDVDQRDKMGETPIFNACRIYRSDVLKLLIEWNCDVSVLNINGLNALNIAFNSECFGCVSGMHELQTQFKEVVKLLVNCDCSVNICDADGQTPLHRACSEGYVDEAELFLKRNSNINQCDKLMKTPLILAVEGRHTKVVSMLVENKCDIGISDKDGRTALDIAVENRVVDIKNILLNTMKKNTNAHHVCTVI